MSCAICSKPFTGNAFGAGTVRAGTPLELISFRVEATRATRRPTLAARKETAIAQTGPESRQVYIRGTGKVDASILDFAALKADHEYQGPAIIERDTTTIWLPPGASATMDMLGNIAIVPQTES